MCANWITRIVIQLNVISNHEIKKWYMGNLAQPLEIFT